MKARIRFEQPGNPDQFDDQVTMGVACLLCLPGVPCLYYGTEQGLHGAGSDPAVREALWGIAPTFPRTGLFYTEIQQVAAVREAQPALRYGRFYFRPISGDSVNFGISPFPAGILAWSRILNDQEILIVANTNTTQTLSVDAILEITLSAPATRFGCSTATSRRPPLRPQSGRSARCRSPRWMARPERARSTRFASHCNPWRRRS